MKILPGLLLCGLISAVKSKKNLRDSAKYRKWREICAVCDMTSAKDTFLNFDSDVSEDSQSSSTLPGQTRLAGLFFSVPDEPTKCPLSEKAAKCAKGCFLQQDIEGKTVTMGCIDDSPDEVKAKFRAIKDNFDTTIFACGEADGTMCLICQDKKKSGDASARCNVRSEKLVTTTTTSTTTTLTSTASTTTTTTVSTTTTTKASVVEPDIIESGSTVETNDKKACDPSAKAASSFNRGSLSSARMLFENHTQKVKSQVSSSNSFGHVAAKSWPSLLTVLALALILD